MNLKAGLVFVYVWQVTAADFLEYFAQILQKNVGCDPGHCYTVVFTKKQTKPQIIFKINMNQQVTE